MRPVSLKEHAMTVRSDVLDLITLLKARAEPFVVATVVRTISVTAAKAGAKAVIAGDGSIAGGWIGGGCARGAVIKASREALADGRSRLVSIAPEDLLSDLGVTAGEERDGIRFARNMCPSQGTMDIFVEPVLPRPPLVVLGASPVAVALSELAPALGFAVTICATKAEQAEFSGVERGVDGLDVPEELRAREDTSVYVVVSTQGRGDEKALKAALAAQPAYLGFVGSRRKAATLRGKLEALGIAGHDLDAIKAPAGLDLGAITPEEIALSILAEIVALRRRGQRDPG